MPPLAEIPQVHYTRGGGGGGPPPLADHTICLMPPLAEIPQVYSPPLFRHPSPSYRSDSLYGMVCSRRAALELFLKQLK